MSWDKERIAQLQLPDPADADPHPRLLLEGYGIHAGQWFTALFPDGWHDITLEVSWEPEGPGCWYIPTPGFEGGWPIGLFGKVSKWRGFQPRHFLLAISYIYDIIEIT